MTLGWYLKNSSCSSRFFGIRRSSVDQWMISACKTFSTLKGCRVEMLNSGLLGWMPKSNLVKVFFFGLFPGFFLWSQTSWMKMAVRNAAWCFWKFWIWKMIQASDYSNMFWFPALHLQSIFHLRKTFLETRSKPPSRFKRDYKRSKLK